MCKAVWLAERMHVVYPMAVVRADDRRVLSRSSADVEALSGLSQDEAASGLRQFGFNELPSAKPRSTLRIALSVLREPMLLLLLGAAAIYFVLGSPKDALILGVFIFVVIGITLYQERKTERALEALRDLSSPRALVIRNGERVRIPGREVVPGDLMILSEGDRIAADGFVLSSANLAIDEALLTGESVAVRKTVKSEAEQCTPPAPGGDDLPYVFSGTLVIRGHGIARAAATGIRTELGKIGKSLAGEHSESSFLQRDARRLIKLSAIGAALLCAAIAILYGLARGDWLRGFLASLTTAMAILPEELPVVLTVFLALGAWRISKVNVLTRNMPAIETLGAASVLCVDKTGTLTMNRMAVGALFVQDRNLDAFEETADLPEEFGPLVETACLASLPGSFDPMDTAIRRFADAVLAGNESRQSDWRLIREYPLSPGLLAITNVWQPQGPDIIAASKGAPEAIADLCRFSEQEKADVAAQVSLLANEGRRVLAVAKASVQGNELPEDLHNLTFKFLGLIGLADPIRPGVPAAIRECREAGIRVIMITGDYAGTALSIAHQAGIGDKPGIINGFELAAMPDEMLAERIGDVDIFARAVPEQKLRLIRAFKARREVVAMTGDGVNDAPALKSADIGIAMGQRGTDVAREAADLVLLNDDFSSIVEAIRMGRRIFDNLKKAIAYTFAIHVPIAGLALIPVLLGWPLLLAPVHIAFLELIIDPACSVVFEAESEEAGIMKRPPRALDEKWFDRRTILLSLLQGIGVLLILLAIFAVAVHRGQGEADARTLVFTTLVIANLSLIQTNRSWTRSFAGIMTIANPAMAWIAGGAVIFLASALYLAPLRRLFGFTVLHPNDIALCVTAGLSSVAWFEGLKLFTRRKGS